MDEVPHRSIAFAKTTRPVVGTAVARERLFARLARNAQRATKFFRIPPDRVCELGTQIEL